MANYSFSAHLSSQEEQNIRIVELGGGETVVTNFGYDISLFQTFEQVIELSQKLNAYIDERLAKVEGYALAQFDSARDNDEAWTLA